MTSNIKEAQFRAQNILHNTSFYLILGLALASLIFSIGAAIGALPWIEVLASWGDQPLPYAGIILQLSLTGLLLGLCFFLPANARIMRLERSHRDFQLSMEDVAQAYRIAHAADRSGVFTLSSEFDDVRDRIHHMRRHPELAALEPEVLEVAAQMSRTSKDLSVIYSDERVARAKAFLKQRQEEVDAFRETITLAQASTDEIRRWLRDIEADEHAAEQQLSRLEKDLREVLPALGYELDDPVISEDNVVTIGAKQPAN
ncbi:MAG: DNA repair protein [Paracoccaceae bacterium]